MPTYMHIQKLTFVDVDKPATKKLKGMQDSKLKLLEKALGGK